MVATCQYLTTLKGKPLPPKRVAQLEWKGAKSWRYFGSVNRTIVMGLPQFHGRGKIVFFTKNGVKNSIRGNWINGVLHGDNIDIQFLLPSGKEYRAKASYIFGQRTCYTVES